MRGLVIVLILLVVIVSISLVVISMNNKDNNRIKTTQENKILEFSTYTSAVCENRKDSFYCKDEVFVNCNGKISKAVGFAECDGLMLDVPKATGSAVFGKGWKDPRG